jgi:NDP-sugar pyrophosphorylase family protein
MQGFDALNGDAALCVGPSADGGFYLIGMTRPTPSLFRGMEYSHPDVFAETRRRMEETGAAHAVLPPWYDVDTPAALRRLMKDLDEEDLDEGSDGEDLNEGSTEPTEEWSRARHTRRALARMNLYERLSAASNQGE